MNIYTVLSITVSLAIGGAVGSVVTYRVTAQDQAACRAADTRGIPPGFFAGKPLPTTGGHRY